MLQGCEQAASYLATLREHVEAIRSGLIRIPDLAAR